MKTKRHNKIIEIIENIDILTQEDLVEKLTEEGFYVTQATVSRDIRELKLTKVPNGKGKQKYALLVQPEEENVNDKYTRIVKDGVIAIDTAQNMLVVKTDSGLAMAVAAVLDAMNFEELVGCIAGDDTIMCATRSDSDAVTMAEKLQKIIK